MDPIQPPIQPQFKNICGWDVGIKHLSFCVIKTPIEPTDIPTFTIEHWKNIDLSDPIPKCGGLLKAKVKAKSKSVPVAVPCTANAKFYRKKKDGSTEYYCGTHKPASCQAKIVELALVRTSPVKSPCQYSVSSDSTSTEPVSLCGKKGNFDVDGHIYCTPHKNLWIKQYIQENNCLPIKKVKCTDMDSQELGTRLFTQLNKHGEIFKHVDEIYIENQPAYKTPTMKSMGSMLLSGCVFMGVQNGTIPRIKYVSAGSKIDLTNELINRVDQFLTEHNQKKKESCGCHYCKLNLNLQKNRALFKNDLSKYEWEYDPTKALGIIYAKWIIEKQNQSDKLVLLEQCDKEDDMCDAFLHAYKQIPKNKIKIKVKAKAKAKTKALPKLSEI